MLVCYFNNDYKNKYDCIYEVKEDGIEIIVSYNIEDELQEINGTKLILSNTKFNERDILIIDFNSKINYLLKNASYKGHTEVLGTPDSGYKTIFFSSIYFYDKNYKKLYNTTEKNISGIKVYSDVINDIIGHPSLCKEKKQDEYIIRLKKEQEKQVININKSNIKSLTISDVWASKHNHKDNEININLSGYIEIDLKENIEYMKVSDYIKNEELYIVFPKIDKKTNPKNYIAKNVDINWIYKRTKILYDIVIDIIFKNMLNYEDYNFNKLF